MKRCSKCIMPDTAKGVTFDENGLCTLCREHKDYTPKGHDALCNEITGFIDTEAEFNCIVPISGGRDSSYALYYVKKILNLKPIAVHSDNDFETTAAKKNLETITRTMDVPLIRVGSKTNVLKKIVSEKFKINAPYGPGLVVDQTCEACKYGFESATYNTARSKKIKVIFWGDSVDENTTSYHKLVKHVKPTKFQRLMDPSVVNYVKYKYYFNVLKKEYGPDSPTGLKEIHLFDYVLWDPKIIEDTIQGEMGWSIPEGSATTWRTDCELVPVVNYMTKLEYGVSKIELGFSNMVRSGKMDREEAIKKVNQIDNETNINALKDFLIKMNISKSTIDKVL